MEILIFWLLGIPIALYYTLKAFKNTHKIWGLPFTLGDYIFIIVGCLIGSWAALLSTLINPILKKK